MAVISISRLQVRRGLRSDLPINLAEGEFGWCLDTRELFIGNGSGYGFNTEILTQYTKNDQLITHTFTGIGTIPAQTGPDPMNPILRPLGSKLDDIASVKDYGATGSGEEDDTAAINRAIADRYGNAAAQGYSLGVYNPIYMPAGTYLISSELLLYPNTALIGDGIGRTEIFLSNLIVEPNVTTIARTVDGNGNSDLNIGDNQGIIPYNIILQDMTLRTDVQPIDMVLPQRVQRFTLNRVALLGPGQQYNSTGFTPQTLSSNVAPPAGLETQFIYLTDSYISNVNVGVEIIDPVSFVNVRGSTINNCYFGIYNGNNVGGPSFTRVEDSIFENISNSGIYVENGTSNPGIVSIDNVFNNVGVINDIQVSPPIYWGSGSIGCASISDSFSYYNSNQNLGVVTIESNGNNTIISSQLPILTSSNVHIHQLGTGIVFPDGTFQYTAAVGQGQTISINDLPGSVQDQQMVATITGRPVPNTYAMIFPVVSDFYIPQNFAGSHATTLTPASASAMFTVSLINTSNVSTQIGTVTFVPNSKSGIFSSTNGNISTVVGDILTIETPGAVDSTLANVGIIILGQKE
jgi:hypothetical protein